MINPLIKLFLHDLSCFDYFQDTGSKGQVFYAKHVTSLVYACAVLLPISYIVGLIFSLKTHRSHIYDTIAAEIEGEDDNGRLTL